MAREEIVASGRNRICRRHLWRPFYTERAARENRNWKCEVGKTEERAGVKPGHYMERRREDGLIRGMHNSCARD